MARRRKRKRNKPKEEARDNQGGEGGWCSTAVKNSRWRRKQKKDKAIITHHASPLLRSGSADSMLLENVFGPLGLGFETCHCSAFAFVKAKARSTSSPSLPQRRALRHAALRWHTAVDALEMQG